MATPRGYARATPGASQGRSRMRDPRPKRRVSCRKQPSKGDLVMSSIALPTPVGPLSASGAPNLPDGFTDTFSSRYIQAGDVRLHAVTGGDGPALLLVHGWPGSWYYWRLVMPALARDFEVIAVD